MDKNGKNKIKNKEKIKIIIKKLNFYIFIISFTKKFQ